MSRRLDPRRSKRPTLLSEETDPNKLHDPQTQLEAHQVYTPEQIDAFVKLYLDGADRDKLDPILGTQTADRRVHRRKGPARHR